MTIYKSKFLSIKKEEDLLLQEWSDEPLTTDDFKQELLMYLSFYKKIKPNQVIWNNHNFNLDIPSSLFEWIEKDILKPQEESGLKNLGFVVSKDELAQLSVINSVKNLKNGLQPNYFASVPEAIDFFSKKSQRNYTSFNYKVKPLITKANIIVSVDYKDLPNTINALEDLKSDLDFTQKNKHKFDTLTPKELEIFYLFAKGLSVKEVAEKLYIEYLTAATHRKKIIKKLELKNNFDWFTYARAFRKN